MSRADRFRKLTEGKDLENTNPNKNDVLDKIIGGESKNIFNEAELNSDKETRQVTDTSNTKTDDLSGNVNNTSDNDNTKVTLKRNSNTEQLNVTQTAHKRVTTRIPKPIEEFEKRLNKPTVEETHTRATWLIRNDLLKRLEKHSRNQQRGFKTHLINYALERILDEVEGKQQ